MNKKRVVVVCPGRGSYNKEDLGFLKRLHAGNAHSKEVVKAFDDFRKSQGRVSLSELDQAKDFSANQHLDGKNAASLISACSLADFGVLKNSKNVEIVAVTGNSMGWYIAASCGGALEIEAAARLIDTMGWLGTTADYGSQMIYPVVGDDWKPEAGREKEVAEHLENVAREFPVQIFRSIRLGGYEVFGGTTAALDRLKKNLPPQQGGRFPLKLQGHAAFHTPVMNAVSEKAREILEPALFQAPSLPLIDGRGKIWQPLESDPSALWDYTLGAQVTSTYDFTRAIEVALKEFAPDHLVLLGPGATLGGSIGQVLVKNRWLGISSQTEFAARQASDPFLVSMGKVETDGSMSQRALL